MKDGTDFSTLTIAQENMMSETNTFQADSGSTDEPARKADVMPTARDQIAQWLAELDRNIATWKHVDTAWCEARIYGWHETRDRVRSIMESINASSQEEGIPTS